MAGKEDHACERHACLFCHSCLPKACHSPPPLSGHGCSVQLPAQQARRNQLSQSRKGIRVVAAPIEHGPPRQDSTGYNHWLPSRPFLAAHPTLALAVGVIPFSRTQTLDKSVSRFHCKMYTHAIKAPLHPFLHPWEIDSSFFYLLFSPFLFSQVAAAKLTAFPCPFL